MEGREEVLWKINENNEQMKLKREMKRLDMAIKTTGKKIKCIILAICYEEKNDGI